METTDQKISLGRRHNPLTFYLRTLLYMFMALVMRAVAFLPLMALFVFPAGSYLRWLAVLCPLLLLFFILPLRFSFAQALVQPARERRFSFDTATSMKNYGEKLAESLLHVLHIFLWSLPLLLMAGAGYYFYSQTDLITLTKGINNLGANITTALYAISNFFAGIFGGAALVPNGGVMEGIYVIGVILAVGALILLWGVVRNSAYRYIWALATREEKNPHAEARRRLRGRRWKQFWVGVLNLVFWAPTLFVVFTTLKGVLSDLSTALFGFMATHQLSLPELSNAIYPLLFAFLICYMPLLPVRRILTAAFATRQLRYAQPEPVAEQNAPAGVETTASGAPLPEAYNPVYVPSAVGPAADVAKQSAEVEPVEPEPAPVPEPVPAYKPYHAEPVIAYQPSEQSAAPVAQPVEAYTPVAPIEPETPVAATQPDAPAPVEPIQMSAQVKEDTFTPESYFGFEKPADPPTVNTAEEMSEEPLASEQEDVFTQPYQPETTVAEEMPELDETVEKPGAQFPKEEGMDI